MNHQKKQIMDVRLHPLSACHENNYNNSEHCYLLDFNCFGL